MPENTGNLTWGGPDWKSLFIPASTSLYRIRTKVGPRPASRTSAEEESVADEHRSPCSSTPRARR